MDITNFATREFIDDSNVALHPLVVGQVGFAADRFHIHRAGILAGGVRCHLKGNSLTHLADKGLKGRGEFFGSNTIYFRDVIALLDIHTWLSKGRTELLVPVGTLENLLYTESTRLFVLAELSPQQAGSDTGHSGFLTAGDIGMADVEFSYHLADEIGEVITVLGVGHHLAILLADMIPINAMHILHIEAVTGDAPALVENLLPLGLMVDIHIHIVRGDSCATCRSAEIGNEKFAGIATHKGLLIIGRDVHRHLHGRVRNLHRFQV